MASPAVEWVDSGVGFASVLRVGVAVAKPWRAGNAAEFIGTSGRAMGIVTPVATSAAVADTARSACLATVSNRSVAVMVGARARGDGTDAICALTDTIGGCALSAASVAVVGIVLNVDFAAITG